MTFFRRPTLSLTATTAVFLAFSMPAGESAAKRNKRGKKAAAPLTQVTEEQEKNLGDLMGEFKFGMTRKQVAKNLSASLRKEYAEKMKESTDIYKQDALRKERNKKIADIKKTYHSFDGKTTGWDVSIIDDEFGHKSKESMLVHWELEEGKEQRRFFFFFKGKLYKMFIALDSKLLKPEQRSFGFFRDVMQARYGEGEMKFRADSEGIEHPHAIEWRTKKHLVRAVNKLDFYDTFALSISSPKAEKAIEIARSKVVRPKPPASVIDSVVSEDGTEPSLDENADVIDALVK